MKEEASLIEQLQLSPLKQKSKEEINTNSKRSTQTMISGLNKIEYKITRYVLSDDALHSTKTKLFKEIDLYNQTIDESSKIQFYASNQMTSEVVIARKISTNQQTLEKIIEKQQQHQNNHKLINLALSVTKQMESLHHQGIVHGNLSLQTIYECNDSAVFDAPLFRWIQKWQRSTYQESKKNMFPHQAAIYFLWEQSLLNCSLDLFFNKQMIKEENRASLLQIINKIQENRLKKMISAMIQLDSSNRPTINDVNLMLKGDNILFKQKIVDTQVIYSFPLINLSTQNCFLSSPAVKFVEEKEKKVQFGHPLWKIQLKQLEQNSVLLKVEIQRLHFQLNYIFRHQRIINYLKQGIVVLRLNAEGRIEIVVNSQATTIISIEKSLKQIKLYLTEQEQNQLKKVSPIFSKIKEKLNQPIFNLLHNKDYQYIELELNSHRWEAIADQLFSLKKYDQAIQMYQKIIQNKPLKIYDIDGLGNTSDQQYGYEGLIYEWYEQNKEKGNIKGSPYDALSLCYSVSRNYQNGLKWYSQMIKKYPMDYRLHYGLANIQFNRFNVLKAEEIYKKVIELKPNFDKSYQHIASTYYQKNYCSTSQKIYPQWAQKALKLNPNNIAAEVMIAAHIPSFEARAVQFEKLLTKNKHRIYCQQQMALKCYWDVSDKQKIDKGVQILKKLIEECPKRYSLYFSLAWIMLDNKDKYKSEQRQKYITKSISLNPHYWRSYNMLANLQNDLNQKIKLYEEAQKFNPFSDLVSCNLADTLQKQKQYKKSIFYYHQTLERNPLRKNIHQKLGNLYHFYMDDRMKALYHYQKSINQVNQDHSNSYFQIGKINQFDHQYNKAIEFYQKAKQLVPKEKLVYWNIGSCYRQLKQYYEAIPYFLKCTQLTPGAAQPITQLIELYSLLGDVQAANKWRCVLRQKKN